MTTITRNSFGKISGREILRYTLSDDALSVSVMPYGASVQRIVYRGRDMILSLPEAELYQKFSAGCIGAVVGRYAGRIADGRFTLDGREYRLSRNQGGNHLHGGRHGFHTKRWSGGIAEDADGGVKFPLLSPDGDEGYPGNLRVSVTYRLTDGDCLAPEIPFPVSQNARITSRVFALGPGVFAGYSAAHRREDRRLELE